MAMLEHFQDIVRRASQFTEETLERKSSSHPFEERAIHEKLPQKVRKLFDDAHYAESTFEAYKFLDRKIQNFSGIKETGYKLMMAALAETGPLKINDLSTDSQKDEQRGYQFILAGAMSALRNPRGHEFDYFDHVETCLDHLSLASMLIRKFEEANYEF
jgi:uncharacterized protein (TIGR02391 family)